MWKPLAFVIVAALLPWFNAYRIGSRHGMQKSHLDDFSHDVGGTLEASNQEEKQASGRPKAPKSKAFPKATQPKAASGQSESDKCAKNLKILQGIGGSVRAAGCNVPGIQYCCDSWMMQFVRDVKAQFVRTSIKVQMWKWTMRPGKDKSRFAHKGAIVHDRRGKIGHDTHYFTVVNYCDGGYAVFDTVDNSGRDVSADFAETFKSGNAKGRELLAQEFTFKYAEDFKGTKPPVAHPYEECVIECKSAWLTPRELTSTNVRQCLTGIIL